MSNWDNIDTITNTLETELDKFKTLMKQVVDPNTWTTDDEWKGQWAVKHDDNMNYDGSVLNIDKKEKELDKALDDYTGDNSYAQQQLHMLEDSTPTDEEESELKETAITYINTWLKLMHTEYDNFLESVTIDEETLSEKYDLIRENLKDYYYSDMQADYVADMEMFAGWTSSDVEEWHEDGSVVPEDFVNDYLDYL